MGTNYYLHTNVCECCGRGDETRHIGKSSGGWCFSLHVDLEYGPKDLNEWRALLSDPGAIIRDEYEQNISLDEMLSTITERSRGDNGRFEKSPIGYGSWREFHRKNHSEFGPNGLLRHAISVGHCVGHGEGTWDYIQGDFS